MSFDGLDRVLDCCCGKMGRQNAPTRKSPTKIIGVFFLRWQSPHPARLTRRRSTWLSAIALVLCLGPFSATATAATSLKTAHKKGNGYSVQIVAEVDGTLKLNADGKKVTEMPFQGKSKLTYDERVMLTPRGTDLGRMARHYSEARTDLRIGDSDFQTELRPTHRLLLAQSVDNALFLYSPGNPLTRDELDLLEVHGDSIHLHRLMPEKEVDLAESWTVADADLAGILKLESVLKSNVTAKLKQIEGDLCIIELSGSVSGAVGGVGTEIELDGKCNFDLKLQRVVWLALHIQENRAIGHAQPGFVAEARIRVAVSPSAPVGALADDQVNSLPKEPPAGAGLLSFSSEKGSYSILHDRGWSVMIDRHDVTILRLVQSGDLVAQCNISKLPSVSEKQPVEKQVSEKNSTEKKPSAPPKGKEQGALTLAEFQAEVQTALGKNFGQVVEAVEQRTSSNLRVFRVVASGTVSEIPILWIYYHLTNDEGRRAAFVFTLESKLAERFGGDDQSILESFQFLDSPTTEPREAKAASKSKR